MWNYVSPGDVVRVGGANGQGAGLNGTVGDELMSATFSVISGSDSVTASINVRDVLADGDLVRLGGQLYQVTVGTEEQQITISHAASDVTTGSFKLKYKDELTSCIDHDALASTVESELESLNEIDDVFVTRRWVGHGYVWNILFTGDGFDGDVDDLEVEEGGSCVAGDWDSILPSEVSTGLAQYSVSLDRAYNGQTNGVVEVYRVAPTFTILEHGIEVQTVTVSASSGAIVAGEFKLQFSGETTGCIAWNADESVVEQELELLNNVDDVRVTRRGDGSSGSPYFNGYVYTIYFVDQAQNVDEVTVTNSGCTAYDPVDVDVLPSTIKDGDSALSELPNAEVQHIQLSTTAMTYDVTSDSSACMSCAEQSLQTVSGVDPTVSVGDNSLLEALYGMSNIGWYNVEVSSANGGLDWYVTFVGVDCIGDMELWPYPPPLALQLFPEFAKGTKNIAKLGMVSTHNFETAGSMNTADTFLGLDRVDVTLYKVSGHRHHVQFLTNLGDIPDFGTNADYLNGGSIVVSEAARAFCR